ncbi:MAG TPA: hypothetical protein P5560_10745 [Thermotogota bacterium]|nr:hypothetical protein [Thermotogota bacterium]HRW93415.1 hypothetical protein [Thermotogota bacterium]
MEALLRFAYFSILGLPVVAWLGIVTYTVLFLTGLFETLKRKKKMKFSLKTHKTMAFSAIVLGAIHGLLVMVTYL